VVNVVLNQICYNNRNNSKAILCRFWVKSERSWRPHWMLRISLYVAQESSSSSYAGKCPDSTKLCKQKSKS